jgi:protein-tyrosine sulfotransferase
MEAPRNSTVSLRENFSLALRRSRRRYAEAKWAPYSMPRPPKVQLTDDALATARILRGTNGPAIMIHGVAQRSGTVFTGELLRLHPDVHAYPRDVFEIPFLNKAEQIVELQRSFLSFYPPNREAFGNGDFLVLFGAALVGHLNRAVPIGKRALFKMPDSRNLAYFPYVFPFEIPLMLMRDGRDVVESTVQSWPDTPFSLACKRWNVNARCMLEQEKIHRGEGSQIFRYEDAVADPAGFVRRLCDACKLDVSRYPFERIDQIGVLGSSMMKREGKVFHDPVAKPPDFNPIGRWRNWTSRQKRTFKRICGEALINAGYVSDNNW